jgi:hypothetical protein
MSEEVAPVGEGLPPVVTFGEVPFDDVSSFPPRTVSGAALVVVWLAASRKASRVSSSLSLRTG